MIGVALAGPHLYASPCESLHRAQAHVRFLAPVLAQMFGHQSHQRTRCAAVGFLRRQRDLYNVSLRHFIFRLSGKTFSLRLLAVCGVALFPDSLA